MADRFFTASFSSCFEFTITTTGTYYIRISANSFQSGLYRLAFAGSTGSAGPAPICSGLGAGDSLKDRKCAALSDLEALSSTNTHTQKALEKAIKHLKKSLKDDRWVDDDNLVAKKGKKVFDEEKKTVKSLNKILKVGGKAFDSGIEGDVSGLIVVLVGVDRDLAFDAIAAANLAAATPPGKKVGKEIAKADSELAKGDAESRPEKAINKFKKAWEHAQKAIKHAT